MTLGLGIDVGGTATRWRLAAADGRIVAEGATTPFAGHLFSRAAEEQAEAAMAAIEAEASPFGRPAGIVAGVTGLTPGTPAEAFIAGLLARTFAIAGERVRVRDDMWIAYLSHFAPGEGFLIYSGTGSIGYHLTAAEEAVRVGGRGNLIDDAGSGFWIAREALKLIWRAEEEEPGAGWTTPLGTAMAAAVGGTDWSTVRAFVYGGGRGAIGTLARPVAAAAEAGDGQALAILQAAGRELARLARCLIRRLGPHPLALAGGAAGLHPAIRAAFAADLPDAGPVSVATAEPAATAARLAATLA